MSTPPATPAAPISNDPWAPRPLLSLPPKSSLRKKAVVVTVSILGAVLVLGGLGVAGALGIRFSTHAVSSAAPRYKLITPNSLLPGTYTFSPAWLHRRLAHYDHGLDPPTRRN